MTFFSQTSCHILSGLLLITADINSEYTCADPEGGGGVAGPDPSPLKNHKNIGFLSNTGPDPLKNHKATKPAFNVGQSLARQRNAI